MIDEAVFALLGLLVAFNVGHLWTLRRCEAALMALTLESRALTDFNPADTVNVLKEEVGDLVADILSTMRPPTIADHLGGMMAQFAQMRMLKMMQADGVVPTELMQQTAHDEPDV